MTKELPTIKLIQLRPADVKYLGDQFAKRRLWRSATFFDLRSGEIIAVTEDSLQGPVLLWQRPFPSEPIEPGSIAI